MSVDRFNVPAILIAVVVVCAALNVASVVFAPMALALLIVAMLWPVQHMLQSVMPRSLALMLSVVLLVVVFALFGSVTLWAFGRTARWIINDVSRFQAAYDQLTVWLEGHGIAVAAIWTEHFNTGSAISLIQTISGRLNTTMSFWVVVLVYVFPLRFIMEAAFAALSGGALPGSPLAEDANDLRFLYVAYGAGCLALSTLYALLYRHHLRRGQPAPDLALTGRIWISNWSILAIMSASSVILALAAPGDVARWAPGFIYMGIPVLIGVSLALRAREFSALSATTDSVDTGDSTS